MVIVDTFNRGIDGWRRALRGARNWDHQLFHFSFVDVAMGTTALFSSHPQRSLDFPLPEHVTYVATTHSGDEPRRRPHGHPYRAAAFVPLTVHHVFNHVRLSWHPPVSIPEMESVLVTLRGNGSSARLAIGSDPSDDAHARDRLLYPKQTPSLELECREHPEMPSRVIMTLSTDKRQPIHVVSEPVTVSSPCRSARALAEFTNASLIWRELPSANRSAHLPHLHPFLPTITVPSHVIFARVNATGAANVLGSLLLRPLAMRDSLTVNVRCNLPLIAPLVVAPRCPEDILAQEDRFRDKIVWLPHTASDCDESSSYWNAMARTRAVAWFVDPAEHTLRQWLQQTASTVCVVQEAQFRTHALWSELVRRSDIVAFIGAKQAAVLPVTDGQVLRIGLRDDNLARGLLKSACSSEDSAMGEEALRAVCWWAFDG